MFKYLTPIAYDQPRKIGFLEKAIRIAIFLPVIILLNLPMIGFILLCMFSVGGFLFAFLLYGVAKDPWSYSFEVALALALLVLAFVGRKVGNYLTWNYLPNVR